MRSRSSLAVALLLLLAALPARGQAPTLSISTGGAIAQGDAAVLDVQCRCEATAITVTGDLLEATLPLMRGADGDWRGLIGVDVLATPGAHPLTLTIERPGMPAATARHSVEVAEKAFPTRTLTVEPRYVEPPPDELDRLTREAVRLNALYRTVTDRSPLQGMQEPIGGALTGGFGSRSVFNGQPRSPHAGTDFRGSVGTPIHAPAGGRVAMAEDLYFTGNTVVIDHGHGVYSILAHMSELGVRAGDEVAPGDLIGKVGATGRVTGPHLHWSIRLLGARVDPLSVLRALTDLDGN